MRRPSVRGVDDVVRPDGAPIGGDLEVARRILHGLDRGGRGVGVEGQGIGVGVQQHLQAVGDEAIRPDGPRHLRGPGQGTNGVGHEGHPDGLLALQDVPLAADLGELLPERLPLPHGPRPRRLLEVDVQAVHGPDRGGPPARRGQPGGRAQEGVDVAGAEPGDLGGLLARREPPGGLVLVVRRGPDVAAVPAGGARAGAAGLDHGDPGGPGGVVVLGAAVRQQMPGDAGARHAGADDDDVGALGQLRRLVVGDVGVRGDLPVGGGGVLDGVARVALSKYQGRQRAGEKKDGRAHDGIVS